MVDHGLMVDRQKIETNRTHNRFCSLAVTEFNSHLIFTVVDEQKLNGFTFTTMFKNKSRGIPITQRHCISNVIALQIQG